MMVSFFPAIIMSRMDAQFEKSARCNVDYDKEGTPRKGTRYVSPAVIQI